MGRTFLPEPVRAGLARITAEAERVSMPIRLAIQVEDPGLARLPWEALPLTGADGVSRAAALHPLVTAYRQVVTAATGRQVPGPLRIVVAIASPVTGGGQLLDFERELRNVVTAVKGARAGQADVRVIPFATMKAIRSALDDGDVHVLHISGHGEPGVLILEKEDGSADPISAAELVKKAVPAGKMPPVITLAACSTNVAGSASAATPNGGLASFAGGLVARGCPVVVATEASITDRYATSVFAQVYRDLALAAEPDPVAAVSRARREVAETLAVSPDPRDREIAVFDEWAIVTVLAAGAGRALFDPKALVPWRASRRVAEPEYGGPLLALDPGEFVGRRGEQHQLRRFLGDTEAGVSGVVIHGLGGIGKTTLAAELVRRALEHNPQTLPVVLVGSCGTEQILQAVSAAVRAALTAAGVLDRFLSLIGLLERGDIPWRDRLGVLRSQVFPQLAVLLVLDNFEDNLESVDAATESRPIVPARGWRIRDDQLAAFLASLVEEPGRCRALVTSRYGFELPRGADSRLRFHQLGPLSYAETMKLVWALSARLTCASAWFPSPQSTSIWAV